MMPTKDDYDKLTFKEFIIYYWERNLKREKTSNEKKISRRKWRAISLNYTLKNKGMLTEKRKKSLPGSVQRK